MLAQQHIGVFGSRRPIGLAAEIARQEVRQLWRAAHAEQPCAQRRQHWQVDVIPTHRCEETVVTCKRCTSLPVFEWHFSDDIEMGLAIPDAIPCQLHKHLHVSQAMAAAPCSSDFLPRAMYSNAHTCGSRRSAYCAFASSSAFALDRTCKIVDITC